MRNGNDMNKEKMSSIAGNGNSEDSVTVIGSSNAKKLKKRNHSDMENVYESGKRRSKQKRKVVEDIDMSNVVSALKDIEKDVTPSKKRKKENVNELIMNNGLVSSNPNSHVSATACASGDMSTDNRKKVKAKMKKHIEQSLADKKHKKKEKYNKKKSIEKLLDTMHIDNKSKKKKHEKKKLHDTIHHEAVHKDIKKEITSEEEKEAVRDQGFSMEQADKVPIQHDVSRRKVKKKKNNKDKQKSLIDKQEKHKKVLFDKISSELSRPSNLGLDESKRKKKVKKAKKNKHSQSTELSKSEKKFNKKKSHDKQVPVREEIQGSVISISEHNARKHKKHKKKSKEKHRESDSMHNDSISTVAQGGHLSRGANNAQVLGTLSYYVPDIKVENIEVPPTEISNCSPIVTRDDSQIGSAIVSQQNILEIDKNVQKESEEKSLEERLARMCVAGPVLHRPESEVGKLLHNVRSHAVSVKIEKELLSEGKPVRIGRWSREEEKILQENWQSFLKDHPPDFDSRCLMGHSDSEEKRVVKTFIKDTHFYQWLACGIDRNLACICNKAKQICCSDDYKKGHFTHEEEDHMMELVERVGKHWSVIAKEMGRSQFQIKDKWYSMQNQSVSGSWSSDEDNLLQEAVLKYREENPDNAADDNGLPWIKLQEAVPGRSLGQCQRRWKVVLQGTAHVTKSGKRAYNLQKARLVERLHGIISDSGINDERLVDWEDLAKQLRFPNRLYVHNLWRLVKRTAKTAGIPGENFQDIVVFTLEVSAPTWKLKRKVYQDA